jgi:hypothetical protein
LPTKLKSKYPRDGAPLEASRSCEGEEALGVRKERWWPPSRTPW